MKTKLATRFAFSEHRGTAAEGLSDKRIVFGTLSRRRGAYHFTVKTEEWPSPQRESAILAAAQGGITGTKHFHAGMFFSAPKWVRKVFGDLFLDFFDWNFRRSINAAIADQYGRDGLVRVDAPNRVEFRDAAGRVVDAFSPNLLVRFDRETLAKVPKDWAGLEALLKSPGGAPTALALGDYLGWGKFLPTDMLRDLDADIDQYGNPIELLRYGKDATPIFAVRVICPSVGDVHVIPVAPLPESNVWAAVASTFGASKENYTFEKQT